MATRLKDFYKLQFQQQHNSLQMALDALNGLGLAIPTVNEVTPAWAKQATSDRPEATQQRAKDYARRVKQIVEAWPGIRWLFLDDDGEVVAEAPSLEAEIARRVSEHRRDKINKLNNK